MKGTPWVPLGGQFYGMTDEAAKRLEELATKAEEAKTTADAAKALSDSLAGAIAEGKDWEYTYTDESGIE